MPWAGNALNRTERWNPYLHRSARCAGGEFGQQRPDGITEHFAARFAALIEGLYGCLNGGPI